MRARRTDVPPDDLPGRSAGAGEPAAAAGAGAEPPADLAELLGIPKALRSVVNGLMPMLKPHLKEAPARLLERAASASDVELARLAATFASRDPRATRRIAFALLAATVLELEAFVPTTLRAVATDARGNLRGLEANPPTPSTDGPAPG